MDNRMAMPMTDQQDHSDVRNNDLPLADYDTIVLEYFPEHVWLTESRNISNHNNDNIDPSNQNNPVSTLDVCFTEHKSQFPILSFPAEIRIMIYRSIWTLPVDLGLSTGLESLALTCRKVRDEILHEYITHILPFTQIHLGSKHKILQGLRASSLLTQHVKHVSLLWGSCVCSRDGDVAQRGNHPGGLRWLSKLQQLTSLELVFTDARYNAMQRFTRSDLALPVAADEDWDEENDGDEDWDEDNGDDNEFLNWFCLDCWEQLMGLPHTLEKVIFKVWCGANENGEAAGPVVRETWDVTKWIRRMKILEERYQRSRNLNVEDRVEDAVVVVEEEVENEDENQEPPTYHIEHHVGDVDVEWPLSDTI